MDAATPPPVAGDERPASNRRAEALGAICEQWLRNGTIDGGLRAAVTLTVDLDTLEGRYGKRCDLDHTGPVTPETARRFLCDADITRVITDGDSEILDLGRATRTPSPAIRKACTCATVTAGSGAVTVPRSCVTPSRRSLAARRRHLTR